MEALPIISLQDPPSTTSKQICDALRNPGFCILTNHGVQQKVLDDLVNAHKAFHELPLSTKMGLRTPYHRGYLPLNASTLVTSHVAKVTTPNQSESIIFSRGAPDAPLVALGPNVWPEEKDVPGFKAAVEEGEAQLSRVAHSLTNLISLGLGVEESFLQSFFNPPSAYLRLLCYPPHPVDAPPNLFGSAPHSDYGFITLVYEGEGSGLQIQLKDGSWFDVHPPPGSFVLNCGDTLHKWTNGELTATPHRVINKSSDSKRYSCVFFYDPFFHAVMKTPFPSCVGEDGVCKFTDISYSKYLLERLAKNYTYKKETQ